MRRIILASLIASLLGFTAAASAKAPSKPHAKPTAQPPAQIDVMTQNQYLGADLVPIVAAGSAVPFDPAAFNAAVMHALGVVAANLPEQRYVALAREISGRQPHVVGLQEVFRFTCIPAAADDPHFPPQVQGNGCDDQAIAGAFNDHLSGTVDALNGTYVAKAIVKNLDVTLPVVTNTGRAYVNVIDRDVILVRSDLDVSTTTVAPFFLACPTTGPSRRSVDGCNYDYVAETSLAGSTLRIERGFVGIDVTIGSSKYRVVNTHLEVRDPSPSPYASFVQSAQAYELINFAMSFPLEADRKLVVIGDMNSDPRDAPIAAPPVPGGVIVPPYMQFVLAGFTDAWTMRPGTATGQGAPLIGWSCCQDEDLGNRHSALYERIDMIFPLVKPSMVMDARLIGTTPASKTPPGGQGLWAADHAAVAATLRY